MFMKKSFILFFCCLWSSVSSADVIIEKPIEIQFVISGFNKFPQYQFFILSNNGKKLITSKHKKLVSHNRGENLKDNNRIISLDTEVILAIDKSGTQNQSLIDTISIKEPENNQNGDLLKVVRYLKISKIEAGKIFFEIEKTELIYDKQRVTQKGALAFENSIYPFISILALVVFVWVLRMIKHN